MSRLRDSFTLIWEAAPGWATARSLILLLQSLLPVAMLYLTKLIIDTLSVSQRGAEQDDIFRTAFFFLIIFVAIHICLSACDALGEMVNAAQSQRIIDHIETQLYRKAVEIDLEYYESSHYYDVLQRAQREASSRPNQILQHSTAVLQGTISLVAILGLLLSISWQIAVILVTASLPAMLVRFKYAGTMYRWQRRKTKIQRQANYFGRLLATDRFAKEIRLFNLGSVFIERFVSLRRKLYQEMLAIIRQRSLANLGVQTLAGLILLLVYSFFIRQTAEGVLKIGDLVLYQQAFDRGQKSLAQMVKNFAFLYEDNLFLANWNEFLAIQSKMSVSAQPTFFPNPIREGITFHNVSFQYPGTSRVAIRGVNLTIRPGETIALVGKNGSGKTTLVKLLCRLYDVTDGKITVDGIDIRDLDLKDLHRQISVIFQDFSRYNVSAQDNIWLGNTALSPDDERVQSAAMRAGAHEVIQSLDRNYQTTLGKQFGDGEELSGGQWQKIALARAFLRDSQIIVLDEPTSAMDPKAEEKVFHRFRELIDKQAAILVTHRLSTVTMADCIYVMSDGLVVEQGTHLALMEKKGVYADLFETQAKKYLFEADLTPAKNDA